MKSTEMFLKHVFNLHYNQMTIVDAYLRISMEQKKKKDYTDFNVIQNCEQDAKHANTVRVRHV